MEIIKPHPGFNYLAPWNCPETAGISSSNEVTAAASCFILDFEMSSRTARALKSCTPDSHKEHAGFY